MARRFSTEDYTAAERFLPTSLLGAVKNAVVAPNWLGDSDWFWYCREDREGGQSYVLYDAATGTREAAFDASAVAAATSHAAGESVDGKALGVTRLDFDAERKSVDVYLREAIVSVDRATGACASKPDRIVAANELVSPCRRFSALVRDHDLWLVDRTTGGERRLTTDGEKNFGYGDLSDASLVAIAVQDGKLTLPPINVVWSPDSRHLITVRVDERHVRAYPLLRTVPEKGAQPTAYTLRRALIGDADQPVSHIVVIDVETGEIRPVSAERSGLEADDDMLGEGTCWFDSRSTTCYIAQTRDRSGIARLVAVDLATGTKRTLIEEQVRGFVNLNLAMYNVPNVRIVGNGEEVVWFSERDGWGHLYLYGGDGAMKRQLTRGDWVVFDIVSIDERRRQIYFTGSSRTPGVNPYMRFLYRVSLDGGEPVLLTQEIADHMIDGVPLPMVILLYRRERQKCVVSPSGRFIVASYSTLDEAPVTVVRSTEDGSVRSTVEVADTSALKAIGYVPPEAFVVKAADGKTDLHGVIYWPPAREANRKYPVVDALYNGFQVSVVPRNFVTGYFTTNPYGARALSELGFIVVTVDARGTALRSRAFHEHSYRNFGDAGIEDHVAALQQLAARYPSFDLERVGASGYSFGGYYSTRLMLKRPDLFKVAVSGAGCHNWQGMYPGYENLIGDNYAALDNALLAGKLRGKLMIFIGDMDENVPAAVNYQFVAALQKANKDYDLLILWNATHWDSALAPYVMRKTWDYFICNLMGESPPDWNA